MPIDDTTIITPDSGTTGGNIEDITPTPTTWSNNPENISIGEGDTLTVRFTYNSPGNDMHISTIKNGKIEDISYTTVKLDVYPLVYQASVTVVGAKKGGGEASFTVYTYRTLEEEPLLTTTTITVEAAKEAKQIKFFDTDKNQLADNKLIAPKYIYAIKQGQIDPSEGTQADNSTKCLKTTNDTAYVKFTYQIESQQSFVTDYSRVSLSNTFKYDNFVYDENRICLNGIIDDPSRNITKNMLLRNGDPNIGFTYWCVVNRPIPVT